MSCTPSHWAAPLYALDKRSAELCRDMTIVGFAFDKGRAHTLAQELRRIEDRARQDADDAVGAPIERTATGGFRTQSLQDAFFRRLRAPIFFRSAITGQPSLGVASLRAYASCADDRLSRLALAIIDWRRARKIRKTYVENVPVGSDGRVHANWLNYGTVSGRWSCQAPNLMNLPRKTSDPTKHLGGVRSLYIPRPGHVLVHFDAKQLEVRVAAYASGDDNMIASAESTDTHAANARLIFGEKYAMGAPPEAQTYAAEGTVEEQIRYKLRTCAKSSVFATNYLAEDDTVLAYIISQGIHDVGMRDVAVMTRNLRRACKIYFGWQARRLLDCIRTGYTDEPVTGRRRYLGHEPKPTDCANFPIQGGAAGLMNLRIPAIVDEIARRRLPSRLVAQCHDAADFETERSAAAEVKAVCSEAFAQPIAISSSGRTLEPVFPIDIEECERWH